MKSGRWAAATAPGSGTAPAVLAGLLACLAAQLLIVLTVVPPWQNPDEPQHLLAVRLIVAHGPGFTLGARDAAGEQQIVASMARHGWWHHYGRQTPDPLPTTFADGPAVVVQDDFVPPSGSRLYYRAVAFVFRTLGIESVVPQMYTMRLLSAAAAMLTVVAVWAGARVWLDLLPTIVTTALLVLHPQFVIVSTTASPDALTNLATAVVWWKALALMKGPATFAELAVMWAAGILAFLTRRMALPLVCGATLVSVLVFGRAILAGRMTAGVRRFGYVFVTLLIVAASAWASAPDDLDVRTMQWQLSLVADTLSAIQSIRFSPEQAAHNLADRLDRLPQFLLGLFESFWIAAGWLRYKASGVWYAGAAFPTAVALAGIALCFARARTIPVTAAFVAVLLQMSAVVIYYLGIMGSGPQGRYLFPVLPAILFLLWAGWNSILSRFVQPSVAALSLVTIFGLLNASAWGFVVLPAFR
jgi:hypothetical protein